MQVIIALAPRNVVRIRRVNIHKVLRIMAGTNWQQVLTVQYIHVICSLLHIVSAFAIIVWLSNKIIKDPS